MVLLSHYLFNYPIFCDKAWLCHTYTTSGCHFSKESQLGARQQKQILDNLIRTEWIKRYWVAHFIQKAEEPGLEATKQEIIPKTYKTGPTKATHCLYCYTRKLSCTTLSTSLDCRFGHRWYHNCLWKLRESFRMPLHNWLCTVLDSLCHCNCQSLTQGHLLGGLYNICLCFSSRES